MAYADPLDERYRAARRKHYENNKDQYLARNAEAKRLKAEHIRERKSVPCMDCGQTYPYYVMDFDHRDPAVKDKNVSQLLSYGWKRFLAEIEKCDVVCSNCHRERTFGPLV